ncbi:AAA family ATPase [Tolypothrix sp. FACHB-123]|uniref:AAA family ATPase n=1 Tax=Tolypothrix sp. FACHB-123 TaxID=2692868 RepID=UPI001686C055|nr:AAA family ATPase [Tolypothrix sp. FACHB-123]MBD2359253.1 AAA family ATPase [Tolypothrix sp. FACHB-123]
MATSLTEINLPQNKVNAPIVLEFIGLPGAGKTTVFQQVVAQLKQQGVSVAAGDQILRDWKHQPLWQRLWKLIPQTQNQWRILWQSLLLATQVKPTNWLSFSKAIKTYANLKRIDAIAQSQKEQLILLDQGLLQEIWSIGITGTTPDLEDIRQELGLIFSQRSIAIVDFQINVETAIHRIKNRPTDQSRFDLMSQEAALQLLSQYAPYLQDIINCAQTFHIPVLEIDSSLAVDEKTQNIVSWINNSLIKHPEVVRL